MNILMLNWRDIRHPDAGGAEIHLQEIGSRWVRWGNSVTLISAGFQGGPREEVIDGVRIKRMGSQYGVYPRAITYLIGGQMKDFDVVFESINTIPFFAPVVSRCPVVAQIYSIDNKSILRQEIPIQKMPLLLCAYGLSSAIPSVYRMSNVTTISGLAKARLIQLGFSDEKVSVARPGISDEFRVLLEKQPVCRRPNSTMVYLGRLKKYKGVQDIINALDLLVKRVPDIRLIVIGKGDYEFALRDLVSRRGLADRVVFCGFVSEEEKAALLSSASLYVCTSRDEGGWTIAAVEAMAAGVPILVTSSQQDLLEEGSNGFLLTSSDPQVIADSVCRILQSEAAWRKLSANAISFSKQFNWDRTAESTMAVLKMASEN